MKLQDQVCTLEQAQKLKAWDVKQESLFYWNHRVAPELTYKAPYTDLLEASSAFTVSELVKMLPAETQDGNFFLQTDKHEDYDELGFVYQTGYKHYSSGHSICLSDLKPTLAEAYAQTLIMLVEASEYPVEEVNSRLQS